MIAAERLDGLIARAWRWRRRILHADGSAVRAGGDARWTPDGVEVRHLERGEMILPDGRAFQSERSTLWKADGPDIQVRFADGRLFHRISHGDRPAAEHDCPPDRYLLRYDFRRWPDWSVRWQVSGPRKDYVAVTLYRPV